jgi:GNAT superfamily N-acetyltransferase
MSLNIKTVTGEGIKPFIPDIASLRITVFREFPYLYDGDQAYEQEYLETYIGSSRSVAVLVLDGERVVGVSTGIPMADETDEFQSPFKEKGFNIEEIFYCGESILLPEYRGRGIYKTFFSEREAHARSFHQYRKICFCSVIRPENHPLKPDSYQSLDNVWEKFGYQRRPDLTTHYSWKDIGKPQDDEKPMVFWIKDLQN